MSKKLPIVAIVGRPNVGKSTLFNRIVGRRIALVHEMPGMTRDRHYAHAEYANKRFVLIDTGGYEDTTHSPLLALMREQTVAAIEQADAIIFLTEQAVWNDPIDLEIINRLRTSGKPFFLAVNKADSYKKVVQAISDFAAYGADAVFPVSALHGEGVLDLLDEICRFLPETPEAKQEDPANRPVRVAIVGRQNVGKSTLVNRLLGEERMVASDIPGTTHDAIDTDLTVHGQRYTLIDTAGIRRRGKIGSGAEGLTVHTSMAAIDRCDVALLILDASEGLTAQDAHISGYIMERSKSCVIVLNKWDAVKDKEKYGEYIQRTREDFKHLKWAPILTISAKTGQRAYKLWDIIAGCAKNYRIKFPTSVLNRILREATSYRSPPVMRNKPLKIKYVTQVAVGPPTFSFFVNDDKLMHFSYERFLQNQFRRTLGLEGTPIKFLYKKKSIEGGWDPAVREKAKGSAASPWREAAGANPEEEEEDGVEEVFVGWGSRASSDDPDEDFEAGSYDEEE
ncbi:MAG: ribosome biogenesis GTPase Der [Sumerlaeia bacterium]